MPKRPSALKAACAARGITLVQLADDLGLSRGTLGQVSRGHSPVWPKLRDEVTNYFGFDPFERYSEDVERLLAERVAQGHPITVQDPAVLRRVAALVDGAKR